MKFGFPGGLSGKESACNAGDSVSILVRKIPWRRDSPPTPVFLGFPGGSDSKESACHERDMGLIPGLGRSPGGRHGNPLQYSILTWRILMDRGDWWTIIHGVAKVGQD